MQFQHIARASRRVQAVNVLCHHGVYMALPLQAGQGQMRRVRLCMRVQHFFAVELKKFRRVLYKKGVRQNFFRRPGPLLMIQAVLRAEIRDAALTRDARPAEKHGAVRLFQQFFQPLFHSSFRLSCQGAARPPASAAPGNTRAGRPKARQRMLLCTYTRCTPCRRTMQRPESRKFLRPNIFHKSLENSIS